jgi:aminopeptidase N
MDHALTYINERFGSYPYPVYSFVQAGDRGMEYPMITLITTHRSLRSLVGVAVHEILHSWYQMVLATNESLFAWMDEGFAEYAEELTMQELERQGFLPSASSSRKQGPSYLSYYRLRELGIEEPMTTHADHFYSNAGYTISTYYKGHIFLKQLEYIIGEEAMQRTMLRYFNTWKFRHPRALDFVRIAELESGMVLDWYYEYWILGTKTIDYAIDTVIPDGGNTIVRLSRIGYIPMPIEVLIKTTKGEEETWYIPLDLMRGEKTQSDHAVWIQLDDWRCAATEYEFIVPSRMNRIEKIEIDPSGRLADIDPGNNVYFIDGHD